MDASPEKYCQALGCVFQAMMNDLKSSIPLWEDFAIKCTKLQSSLKVSVLALGAFLDAFQKLADLSMNSKGSARELGSSLTRLCMRHRTIEAKLKIISGSLVDQLATPTLEKIEEWKRNAINIDKERTRDYKKARQEVKRASMDTLRIQKKVRKASGTGSTSGANSNCNPTMASSGSGISGNARSFSNAPMGTLPRDSGIVAQAQLEYALQDVNARWSALHETELSSVRKAMFEERSRYCFLVGCFKPMIEQEVSLLSEMACFQEIAERLGQLTADNDALPSECEQLLADLRNSPETLLKSFGQSQTPSLLSQSQSQTSSLMASADAVSVCSGVSDAHSAGSSSGGSNSNPNLLAAAASDATSNIESGPDARPDVPLHTRGPVAPLRRESIASVGSETLLRRVNQKNAPHGAVGTLHHCHTESTNLLHASVVSMSTNSLASNASRSSCSSAGQPHPHAPLIPKSVIAGVSASSAASALLCVAAAARNAAAKATSQDSGFISQDTLYAACPIARAAPPAAVSGATNIRDKQRTGSQSQTEDGIIWMQNKDDSPESALENFENYIGQVARQLGDMTDDLPPSRSNSPSHASSASPVSTWTNWPEQPGYFDPKVLNAQLQLRPYTVSASSGSRKPHHHRPPLNERMFEPPTMLAGDISAPSSAEISDEIEEHKALPKVTPNKCTTLREQVQSHYGAIAQQTRKTIEEDSFESTMQDSLLEVDAECTLTRGAGICDEDFPAPPSADILQRIATECVQQTNLHPLRRGDTIDALPLPPPPSDYADPARSPASASTTDNCDPNKRSFHARRNSVDTQPFSAVRSLANESSPISKLIRELGAKNDRQRIDDQSVPLRTSAASSEQQHYAAVSNSTSQYGEMYSEQVYAAPINSAVVARQGRPIEQSEYAQAGVRHPSRSRPAPPQRRSSVQLTSAGVVQPALSLPQSRHPCSNTEHNQITPSHSEYQSQAALYQFPAAASIQPNLPSWNSNSSVTVAANNFARPLSKPDGRQPRDRIGMMQVVAMPVDIQPSSGSLTSHAPLAVPIPAVRMSIGGIAACPPELSEHTGAILRQIKNGVNLRHCAASLINDKSRPMLRF